MTHALVALSQSLARITAAIAPRLSAIRTGPNQHMTGLLCEGGVIVTSDQALPAFDIYTVVLSAGHLVAARPGPRDPDNNLATLWIEPAGRPIDNPEIASAEAGNIAVIVAADADASPTVRLTVIHRLLRTIGGPTPVLDVSGRDVGPGCLVLDALGRLIGLTSLAAHGEVVATSAPVIGRMLAPKSGYSAPPPAPPVLSPITRRGWLGVALQPITVPDALLPRTGQPSGRMVVSITKGGPAEKAGLRIGDVVLALNGTGTSGPHALRAFLGSEQIGSSIEIRLLRDGTVLTTHLTIAAYPG
jgi:S1-C subfamily serine protease